MKALSSRPLSTRGNTTSLSIQFLDFLQLSSGYNFLSYRINSFKADGLTDR